MQVVYLYYWESCKKRKGTANRNSDENFVNNDTLNSFVVNFVNFCKNTFKI